MTLTGHFTLNYGFAQACLAPAVYAVAIGIHRINLNDDGPVVAAAKMYSHGTLVLDRKRFMWLFAGFSGERRVTSRQLNGRNTDFSLFGYSIFGTFKHKAKFIILLFTDTELDDLE